MAQWSYLFHLIVVENSLHFKFLKNWLSLIKNTMLFCKISLETCNFYSYICFTAIIPYDLLKIENYVKIEVTLQIKVY